MTYTLSVASQFSRFPGLRFKRLSEFSGEEFRDDLLIPAIRENGKVVVDLDGVVGYGSSFLEEAFGGLVRTMKWPSRAEVDKHVAIKSQRESWLMEANTYIDQAVGRLARSSAGAN